MTLLYWYCQDGKTVSGHNAWHVSTIIQVLGLLAGYVQLVDARIFLGKIGGCVPLRGPPRVRYLWLVWVKTWLAWLELASS